MAATHDAAGQRRSVLRGVLSDLSLPQVAGTALAAVTSMLLSSYIGIAGSIIGVAAASVVSTVCASLYKNFLAASAERIREIPQVVHGGTAAMPSAGDAGAEARGALAVDAGAAAATSGAAAPQETARLSRPPVAASPAEPASSELGEDHLTATPHLGDAGVPVADAVREAHEARLRKARLRRGVVIVAVVSALAAVAVSAGAVWFLTMGQGLGAKPDPVRFSAPSRTQAADEQSADKAADEGKDASSGQGDAATAAADDAANGTAGSAADKGATSGGGDASGSSQTGDGATSGTATGSGSGADGSAGSTGSTGGSASSGGSGADGTGSSGSSGGSGSAGSGSGATSGDGAGSAGSSQGSGGSGSSAAGAAGSGGSAAS